MNYKEKVGLSRENRNFLVGLVFALLLIFGPVEPYGMLVRIVYLITIPVLVYFFLKSFGKKWAIDESRAVVACIAGALLVGAYLSLTANYHTKCDQYVQTRDGQECVGDYVTVKGPDKSGAFMQLVFAGFAIWYAIKRKEDND